MKKDVIKKIFCSLFLILFVAGCATQEIKKDNEDSSNEVSSEHILANVQKIKGARIIYPEEVSLDFDGEKWESKNLTTVDQEAVNEFLTETLTLSGKLTEDINQKELNNSPLIFAIEFINGENQKTKLNVYEIQEAFYGQIDSENEIYSLPTISNEMHHFHSYFLAKSIPTTVEDISEIKIKDKENEEILLNQSTSMNEIERSPFISGWYLHGVYETDFSIEYRAMEEILHTLKNLKGLPIEEKDSLKEYDKIIQIRDQENTDYLYISSGEYKEDICRVWVDSTKTIYKVPKFLIKPLDFVPLDIVDNFISAIPLDAVQEINIQEDGKETIQIKAIHDLIEEKEQTKIVSTFFVNDEEVEEDLFRKAYQYLISLSYDQEITENITKDKSQKAPFSIVYKYKNAGELIQSEILFHPTNDEDKLIVTKDGITEFVVNKQKVEEALRQFDLFK